MEPELGGEFGAVVDWLVGLDDGSEILWEFSEELMLRRGEVLADCRFGDPLGVNLGLRCGVPRAELWAEPWWLVGGFNTA